MRKSLRRFCAYLLIKVLVSLARVLPRRLGSAVFGNLGAVAYLCLRKSRRIALVNLRLIYGRAAPDKEIRRIARRAFINLGKFAYDVVNLNRVAPQGLARIIEVTGLDNLDRALDRGKGVILLSGHVGNWELMAAYLSRAGYPLNVLATRLKDSRLDQLIAGLRRNVGIAVLERSGGLKAALRCLNRGEILGILIDQDTSVESVLVDFLGRPTKTAVGPVKLASRTGAAIVPLAMLMTDNGHYRIEVKEPLVVSGQEASLVNDVERCSKAVETFIRAEPSQWVWMHRRWKSVVSNLYS